MPELPELQAHAERLSARFAGRELAGFQPLTFTALKTATPSPDLARGQRVLSISRRGKYLLVNFEPVTFAVHLMQGGRLISDEKLSRKPRGGQARFSFADGPPALLLTEAGTERRAGVWCLPAAETLDSAPLNRLGPEADQVTRARLAQLLAADNRRIHGFLRDQQALAGLGRRLVDEGLRHERSQPEMTASKDRPGRVHGRTGQQCEVCGDVVRAVEYSGYTVNYCATCQTGGRILADNTTSKFLR